MKSTKKVRITSKGSLRKNIYAPAARYKAMRHGVAVRSLKSKSGGKIEVVLEGDKDNLWKMIHWSKIGPVFCTVDELTFEFIQVE